jgi:hypothetical protein
MRFSFLHYIIRKMLKICFDPDNEFHSLRDNATESFVKDISDYWNSDPDVSEMNVIVSNMLTIDCFRVYVKEGVIFCQDIVFLYKGVEFIVDKDGRFLSNDFPYGAVDNFLSRLL